MRRITRRDFLRKSGGTAAILAGSSIGLLAGCTNQPPAQLATASTSPALLPVAATAMASPGTATAPAAGGGFVPDVEIDLKATPSVVQILPGKPTRVWGYQADLIRGDPDSLQPLADTYLGPLIRVTKGQKVRVHFRNDLPEPSIVHWHGLLIPSRMDGHPRDAIQPGQTYVYDFEVINRAGTYWYHPHPEPLTGAQVMRGLAGLFLVSDDEENAAGLPTGSYDVPLVIQDRTFDQDNQIVYLKDDAMSGMASMDRLMGFLGEQILVNGQRTPLLPVATRAYRLRLLNGSNSRVYKLAWSHGAPFTVIGTDGGLLERPVERQYVMLSPGERVELWADFSQFPLGAEIVLQSQAFLGAEGDSLMEGAGATPAPGAMSGMAGMPTPAGGSQAAGGMAEYNPALPNGAAFPILHIRVARQEKETLVLPARLSTFSRYDISQAVNGARPRHFGLSLRNATWLINGRSFELEEVAPYEIVKVGSIEAWEFVNETNPNEPMEKLGMVHPMHIHGVQFQVTDRQVMAPELKAGWDSVHEGYVDEGWKDTVLIMPGERVRLLTEFRFPDLFLFHCHNLEHEDLGMMRNYRADS